MTDNYVSSPFLDLNLCDVYKASFASVVKHLDKQKDVVSIRLVPF